MLTNEKLIAEYAYLDDLDCRGWAWEFLRRNDKYRTDYDRLQTLERPEPFDSEHAALTKKWHVRRLLDPSSREVPEFIHERWQKIPADLMWRSPREWQALMIEKTPPGFNSQTWKRSIICKDLRDQKYSLNKAAEKLYPGYEGTLSLLRSRDR